MVKQLSGQEDSLKIEYESDSKASDIESLCKPLSCMSLDKRYENIRSKLKQSTVKFKDEAELSKRIISKLPCIKSCNKVTMLKDYESERDLDEPSRETHQC